MKLIATIILLLLLSGLSSVYACSCLEPGPPCQASWNYTDVFVGMALSITETEVDWGDGKIQQRLVHFRVIESFRGEKRASVEVVTGMGGGDCGYNFDPGKTYLVYGNGVKNKPRVATSICSRTRPISEARPDLSYLRSFSFRRPGSQIFGTARKFNVDPKTGAWMRPVPLAGVVVVATSETDSVQQRTNRSGRYSFQNLLAGKYEVHAKMPPRLSEPKDENIEIHDRGCAEINYRVVIDGRIRGRLFDVDGRPVAIKSVDLIPTSLAEGQRGFYAITEQDGSFEFKLLAAGRYLLGINLVATPSEDLPYKRVFYGSPSNRSEARVITLGEGRQIQGIEFRLGPALVPARIDGVVVWPDGRPGVGAEVTLTDIVSKRDAKWGIKADANGRFSVQAFQGVAYKISATIPADPSWNPDSGRPVALLSTQSVELTASANAEPVRLTIGDDGIRRTKVIVGGATNERRKP